MPQSGNTPIQHYRSATAAAVPLAANLVFGELALNYRDGNLFFKDNFNAVRLLASTAAATGTVSSVQASGGTTGLTFSGGPITTSGTLTLGGTLAVANGGTGVTTSTGTGSVVLNTNPAFAGNVGIGTTTLNSVLNVSFIPPPSVPALGSGVGGVSIGAATSYGMLLGTTVEGLGYIQQQRFDGGSATYTLALQPNGGDVGVGTASVTPVFGRTLQIGSGSTEASVSVVGATTSGFLATTGSSFAVFARSGGNLLFGAGDVERMRVTAAGDVGIGTGAPARRFVVNNAAGFPVSSFVSGLSLSPGSLDAGEVFEISGTSAVNGLTFSPSDARLITFGASPSNRAYIRAAALDVVSIGETVFTTNGTERMRVTAAGNVGIGTTTPAERLSVAGNITATGSLTLGTALAVANGGTGATTAAAARANLGATTLGGNLFTLANPSAVTFPRFNADNTASALSAADFRTAIGAGTVTSVTGTGSVNGIVLTGTVTGSGNLTLGGALSGVSLTSAVTGLLPVANGGTGSSSAADARSALGVAASGAVGSSGLTMSTARVLGRATAGTGAVEEITIGAGLSLTGGTLSATGGGTGSVTSVQISGGSTGLTASGGPITASGTITLGGTLAVSNGGTGATSAAAALTALGAYSAANPSGFTSNAGTVTSVGGTGTVNGLSLSGTVTTSGNLTLEGSLSGINLGSQTTGTLAVARGGTGATDAANARTNLSAAARAQVEQVSGFIATPANKLYRVVIKMAYAGTITETTTRSASGTCTATFAINGTNLGGAANSVSSTEQSVARSTSNTFAAGDDIEMTVSANSSCVDLSFTIAISRTLS